MAHSNEFMERLAVAAYAASHNCTVEELEQHDVDAAIRDVLPVVRASLEQQQYAVRNRIGGLVFKGTLEEAREFRAQTPNARLDIEPIN